MLCTGRVFSLEGKTPSGQTVPAERMAKIKDAFPLDARRVAMMRKEAMIMHPLPRVDEIEPEVDRDPRSAYF